VKGGASILAGPAGYAVPIVVGAVLVYWLYSKIKSGATAAIQSALPGDNQPTLNYLFGIGPPQNPDPTANQGMGGANFGITPGLDKGW
jgi:hypothetical protein